MVILFTDVGDTVGYGKYAGTYRLATELRQHGYPTQVIDHFRHFGVKKNKEILKKFLTQETLLIGISLTLLKGYRDKSIWGISEDDFVEFVNYAKSINPNVKIVVGGFQVTSASDWPYIDYAVTNKADNAIIALLEHLKDGKELKFKQNTNTKIVNGDDYFFTQEQFSDSKIIFEDYDIVLPGESLPIELARGCIFKCAFCWHDLIGKRIGDWTKTEDALYEELLENYNRFGTTQYMVSDELVNENNAKLEMLVRVAKRLPFKFEYTAYARIDLVARFPEQIELLKESGAVGLAFGIETFHEEAGKAVGKGMKADKIKKALRDCKASWGNDILLTANFMIGLPGEPVESVMETIDYLSAPDCPIDTFELNLLNLQKTEGDKPGNKIGDDPEKFGFELGENNYWVNKNMDRHTGEELMRKIKTNEVIMNKRKFTSAIYIGRILSLGYTVRDVFDAIYNRNYKETRKDTYIKSYKMKLEYYKRLMSL